MEISRQVGLAGAKGTSARFADWNSGWQLVVRIHEHGCGATDRRLGSNRIYRAFLDQQTALEVQRARGLPTVVRHAWRFSRRLHKFRSPLRRAANQHVLIAPPARPD